MIRQRGESVVIDILVQPRASRARVGPVVGERLKVAVTEPPVDGKANAAVVRLLAKFFAIPRRQVVVINGLGSRRKSVRVAGLARETALARIPEAS